ncbi:hypothetical protein Glove_421g108 [Diversispora epigaea]|uniref:Uncharacterized protein n=1 Tax=Diversispora epigaea TaxID=1348612 RepID=A0A397GZS0_9GLOM|nr:hypothetical protein Glove_421g108 [Diversispora epigaea]
MLHYRHLLMLKFSQLFTSTIYLWNKGTHVPKPVLKYFFKAYWQIENNFELDLRNRAFLSELNTKELKDGELERLTTFLTVDSLGCTSSANSIFLYIETTSLSFKRRSKSTKNESRYNHIY